jgi:hypothetical protein
VLSAAVHVGSWPYVTACAYHSSSFYPPYATVTRVEGRSKKNKEKRQKKTRGKKRLIETVCVNARPPCCPCQRFLPPWNLGKPSKCNTIVLAKFQPDRAAPSTPRDLDPRDMAGLGGASPDGICAPCNSQHHLTAWNGAEKHLYEPFAPWNVSENTHGVPRHHSSSFQNYFRGDWKHAHRSFVLHSCYLPALVVRNHRSGDTMTRCMGTRCFSSTTESLSRRVSSRKKPPTLPPFG